MKAIHKMRRVLKLDPLAHQRLRFERFRWRWARRLCCLGPEQEPSYHLSEGHPSTPSTYLPSPVEDHEKIRPVLRRTSGTVRRPVVDPNGSPEVSRKGPYFAFGQRDSHVQLHAMNPDPASGPSGPSSSGPSSSDLVRSSGILRVLVPEGVTARKPVAPNARLDGPSKRPKNPRRVSFPRAPSPFPAEEQNLKSHSSSDLLSHFPRSTSWSDMLGLLMQAVPGHRNAQPSSSAAVPKNKKPILPSDTNSEGSSDSMVPAPLSICPQSASAASTPVTTDAGPGSLPAPSPSARWLSQGTRSGSSRHTGRQQGQDSTPQGRFVIYHRGPTPRIVPRKDGVLFQTEHPMEVSEIQVGNERKQPSLLISPDLSSGLSLEPARRSRRHSRTRERRIERQPRALETPAPEASGSSPREAVLEAGRAAQGRRRKSMSKSRLPVRVRDATESQ
ncbi:uncharacterized protein BDV14DRAFT_198265 [Aspergillus stella-maris]|uniref:uncharacterized protein n=1 Tax=Aspergillus stella-maris TaxID=1810926 RepID=UPI003CCD597C